MNDVLWVAIISGFCSLAGSWLIATVALKKVPVEVKKQEAETTALYQKIANDAAEQIDGMTQRQEAAKLLADERYEALKKQTDESRSKRDKEFSDLQRRVDELECALEERDRLLEEWQEGITQLINQIEANRLTPVWRPRRLAKTKKAKEEVKDDSDG